MPRAAQHVRRHCAPQAVSEREVSPSGNRRRAGAWVAALSLSLSLATALLGASCADDASGPRRSVLLVTLDTTRPDVLGAYGGPAGATPFLDRLASEAVVYDRAYTVSPLTQPSHASLFTGLLPPRHGVRINGVGGLSPQAETLAEAARTAGFTTGAFVGALVLDAAFGLDQGFERYTAPRDTLGSSDSHVEERSAQAVVDDALAWFEALDSQAPFFAWVHCFDPHGPYAPPPEYRLGKSTRTLYQGELAYVDRQLARLFEHVQALPEPPLIVVVADHGEAFGEHGEQTHGTFCYDTTVRIPLLVRYPDGFRAGERSGEVVGLVDLHATLAEALGVGSAGTDGTSFYRRTAEEARTADGGAYFESYYGYLAYGTSPLAGWVDAGGKYVHSSQPEFFAADDGAEGQNAIETTDVAPYVRALERATDVEALPLTTGAATAALDDELRDLGYASAGASAEALPSPLDRSAAARPSPREVLSAINEALLAQELSNQGRFAEAEERLQRVVATHPGNPFALDRLATALMQQGKYAQALPHLRRVVAEGPGWPGSSFNLGAVLFELGQVEEALGPLRQAVAAKPGEQLFRDLLVRALRATGRDEEADTLEASSSTPPAGNQ